MSRGEIWVAASAGAYSSKPRPVLVVQNDLFDRTESVAICPLTTTEANADYIRVAVEPNSLNGLAQKSFVMIDKVTTLPRARLDKFVGRVSASEVNLVSRGLAIFLATGLPVGETGSQSQ